MTTGRPVKRSRRTQQEDGMRRWRFAEAAMLRKTVGGPHRTAGQVDHPEVISAQFHPGGADQHHPPAAHLQR